MVFFSPALLLNPRGLCIITQRAERRFKDQVENDRFDGELIRGAWEKLDKEPLDKICKEVSVHDQVDAIQTEIIKQLDCLELLEPKEPESDLKV